MHYSPCCSAKTYDPELGRCPKCKENVEEDQWQKEIDWLKEDDSENQSWIDAMKLVVKPKEKSYE